MRTIPYLVWVLGEGDKHHHLRRFAVGWHNIRAIARNVRQTPCTTSANSLHTFFLMGYLLGMPYHSIQNSFTFGSGLVPL